MDVYSDYVLKNCTPEDLPAKTKEMADFKELYKNPLFVILITFSEVLPIGLVVALVSALILKRKRKWFLWFDNQRYNTIVCMKLS